MAMPKWKTIELTDDQWNELEPIFDQAEAAHEMGETGLILANIGRCRGIRAIFVPNEYAKPIQTLMYDWESKIISGEIK